jgi:hypothetical protein
MDSTLTPTLSRQQERGSIRLNHPILIWGLINRQGSYQGHQVSTFNFLMTFLINSLEFLRRSP